MEYREYQALSREAQDQYLLPLKDSPQFQMLKYRLLDRLGINLNLRGHALEMDVMKDGLMRAGIEMVFNEIEALAIFEEHYGDQ